MPKIYFYDSGLACSLLGIENKKQLKNHALKGNLFESFVISEILKTRFNRGLGANLYFWRDKTGHEIDCLMDQPNQLVAIEIKSGKTVTEGYFKEIQYWKKLVKGRSSAYLIYGGNTPQKRSEVYVLNWQDISPIL